jgi:5-methylcytosine-specific restriction enzyme subunit McrC
VQPLLVANQPVPERPDIEMRPDVLIGRGDQRLLVVDAKWKRLASVLRTADLYQMLAYCTGLGVRRAVLVYPGGRDRTWTYTLAHSPVTVTVHALRITGPRERCVRSLERFGRRLL